MYVQPVYESFKYIHTSADRNNMDVLEYKYKTVEMLNGRFTVYSAGNGYRVYPSAADFLMHLSEMTISERVYHEVIFQQPQKLRFDIDAEIEKLSQFVSPAEIACTHEDKYKHILSMIQQSIKDAFFTSYGYDFADENQIICSSQHVDQKVLKYSNHIIIDGYYVSSYVQARELATRVYNYLPVPYRRFLDIGVYKSTQNFRIAGCHKGDGRVKTIVTGHQPIQTLITYLVDCAPLPDIAVVDHIQDDIHPDDIGRILDICRRECILDDHKFRYARNNKLIFTRIHASRCEFCNRVHEFDNTLIVSTTNVAGVIHIYKQCRKYNAEHSDSYRADKLGEILSDLIKPARPAQSPAEKCWVDRVVARSIQDLQSASQALTSTSLFDSIPAENKHIYSDRVIHPLELADTLIVHAAMKMGKTKSLSEYIDKHFNSTLRDPVIRFISFRQTFSGNIKEKFKDFVLYSDVRGGLYQKKLIVQVESLFRVEINHGDEPPDLLILDECESIFEQIDSGLMRDNFDKCFAVLQYFMRYTKHVVCMDAGVSDRTYRILSQMRPHFPDNCIYHHNTYKNATEDQYYLTGDKAKWLSLLYTALDSDERVTIPISSLTEAKVLLKNLTKKYPTKQIKLYSSETAPSEKCEHFANVNVYWTQYDVLIYTPTVSAGVSFEQNHFNKIFGYFTDQSCPVETCVQMIGRIRDVGDNQFYIYLSATGNSLPVTIESIKNYIYTKRANLTAVFDDTGLRYEYGPHGEVLYQSSDYFHIWLENVRVKNLSKNSFIKRFIAVVSSSGANINLLTDDIFEQNTGLLSDAADDLLQEHSTARSEVKAELSERIAAADELGEREIEEIYELIASQKDITDTQRYAFEKHRLRIDYNYPHAIDKKFVAKYHDVRVKRIFKNLSRIYSCDNISLACDQIKIEELASHKYLMSLSHTYYNDLNRIYVYDQHRFAIGLLKLCGWNSIVDYKYIHKSILYQNLASAKDYWNTIRAACVEFAIKPPKVQDINPDTMPVILKKINEILSIMYGLSIRMKRNEPCLYMLRSKAPFTFNEADSMNKHIPLINVKK